MGIYEIFIDKDGELFLVGEYYIYSRNSFTYRPALFTDDIKDDVPDKHLFSEIKSERPIDFIEKMISKENRDKEAELCTYHSGPYTIIRESEPIGDDFIVFSTRAHRGEKGYSNVSHSRPHYEGGKTSIDEWVGHYSFHKMEDGTYQAELDMGWYWGGSHGDGGTITKRIPEEWFEHSYDEFLENLITLVLAREFKFTVNDLKRQAGLKRFFGFEEIPEY